MPPQPDYAKPTLRLNAKISIKPRARFWNSKSHLPQAEVFENSVFSHDRPRNEGASQLGIVFRIMLPPGAPGSDLTANYGFSGRSYG
jgi:hypothetical protein